MFNKSAKQKLLLSLYQKLEKNYQKYPLAKNFEDIIPGEGSAAAKILFIGEAPGFHETIERRPFVGRSGKLFRKVLLEEAKILESEVYISNIIKVRPPENRDPTLKEIEAFKSILDKEIEIIKPKLIVTLGRFSMNKFLPNTKISQIRGKLHKIEWFDNNIFILPMYHPAAALRSNKMRKAFIDDFRKIPEIISWIENFLKTDNLKNSVKNGAVEHLF